MFIVFRRSGVALQSNASGVVIPFTKLLVANRGEIACRVMRTARRLGIQTVGVHCTMDAAAKHVAMADEAFCLGDPPASTSYLRIDRIIEAAQATGADAVHPGYGFLSENAEFARALEAAGITFIGPPASAIAAMGSKSESKRIMRNAGVPVVPGYESDDQSTDALHAAAISVGFPLMLKAVAGGGGRGMRIVHKEEDFIEQLRSCQREALGAFGNADVIMERYIERSRHIEVQIMGDTFGNAVHYFDRDCSIQRRHQKIFEEAPAPGIDESERARICATACDAAKAVGYVGAGTVEFIYDCSTGEAFFMEMNTRLQVEHPVTEWLCATDLVEQQLLVAGGAPAVAPAGRVGHCIEVRVCAESPRDNFLPSSGPLRLLRFPDNLVTGIERSEGVRVDCGVRPGDEISQYYDSLIAKVIVKGSDRADAVAKLQNALRETHIGPIETNLSFLTAVSQHPAYIAHDDVDSTFVGKFLPELLQATIAPPMGFDRPSCAAVAAILSELSLDARRLSQVREAPSRVPEGYQPVAVAPPSAKTPIYGGRCFRNGGRSVSHVPLSALKVSGSGTGTEWGNVEFVLRHSGPLSWNVSATNGVGVVLDGPSDWSTQVILSLTDVRTDLPKGSEFDSAAANTHRAAGLCTYFAGTAKLGPHGRNERFEALITSPAGDVFLIFKGHPVQHFRMPDIPPHMADPKLAEIATSGTAQLVASMSGKIIQVNVANGDTVAAGDVILVLEAMKMETKMLAPVAGTVSFPALLSPGTQVLRSDILALVTPADSA